MSTGVTTLQRARELAGEGNVVPIVDSFVDDTETPVSAFLKLRDDGPSFLLESAEQGGRLGRYSFLGFSPHLLVRWVAGELLEWEGGAADGSEPSRRTPAPSVCSVTTSSGPSNRSASRTPTRSGSPTSR